MAKVFLILFVLIPLAELYVLIQVGGVIGALPTVLLTVFTAIAGFLLMRTQGMSTLQQAQVAMAQGEAPQMAMMEGVFIFLGGVLGLLFLIPFVRRALIRQTMKGFAVKGHYRYQNSRGDTFEGEWREAEPKKPQNLTHQQPIEGELLGGDKSSDKK
jgi:UPF0716 protein FxsA